MNNNQGNYLHFRARLPPPPAFLQSGTSPYGPPVPVPQSGPLTSGQSYLSWSQSQHISPQIPSIGYQPPRIPPPLLPPQLPSTYFTPTHSGSFVQPPPPPPPSSPPPGPPPLPLSSPPLSDNSHVNGSETRVKDTSDLNILSDTPPLLPKDEKIVRNIEVLCQYIAKNGQEFEEITCQKEVGNPDFDFLFGGEPGSEAAISHEYFKWMKRKCLASEFHEGGHDGNLSLKPSVVSELHEDISHSPSGSDMDMEDDITHPEESFGNGNNKQAFVSNEVDTNFEKSNMNVGDADFEPSLVCKTEQVSHNNINVPKEMNQLEQSPFKLIQGYASDDTSENDNDPHFESVSPVAVSPQVQQHTTLSVPVMEGFLNIKSKVPEPSTESEKLENRTNDVKQISGVQKEDNNNNNTVKLDVDEFGRVVKKGGNDSDSDDYSTRRRRIKRGKSRSRSRSPYKRRRSRSPYERRRRKSPQRRREKRSRSRSWSPKKRGRSRSPHDRRNRNDSQEICYDFRRGRCFRGATCRFLHDRQKTVESRWHRNKQDTSFPEKEDINHNVSRSSDRLKEEFVEPPGHSADVASSHETAEHLATEHTATEMAITGQIPIGDHPLNQTSSPKPQPVNEYNLMPPVTMWNSLLPPPPRPPQLGGTMLQFQINQPPFQTTYPFHLGSYPMNYPILQQPAIINQNNFPRISSPNLVSSNSTIQSFLQNPASDNISDFTRSRFASHYNPYASTFDQPLTTKFSSGVFTQDYGFSTNQNQTADEGQSGNNAHDPVMSGGDQYDPLFDSIDPFSNLLKKSEAVAASEEKDEFGEVGAVENDSPTPSSPMDLPDMATMEVEIDQVKPKKSKDSRSTKLFKIAIADFVKEVLKPSWRQGNMSKEAFKTIVKKTVEKVSGAMKKHHIPKSQAKINHYIDSSQRKLTKLVMGYVDKYVKV